MRSKERTARTFTAAWVAACGALSCRTAGQPAISFEQETFRTRCERGGVVEDGLASVTASAVHGARVGRWRFRLEKGWLRRCVTFPHPVPADATHVSIWLRLVPKPADDFLRPTLSLELWERREGTRGQDTGGG